MEVAVGIKSAISNKAVDVSMPGQEVAKGLDGGDEGGFKRFMGENGAKEFIDSFGGTACKESQQFSIAIEKPTQYLWDGKDPLTVRDIVQDIIFDP